MPHSYLTLAVGSQGLICWLRLDVLNAQSLLISLTATRCSAAAAYITRAKSHSDISPSLPHTRSARLAHTAYGLIHLLETRATTQSVRTTEGEREELEVCGWLDL